MCIYSTSVKKKNENTEVQSCRFSVVLQKNISAHASLFPYPGSTGTNPKPCQTLELCNCLIETRLYLQGLFSTEVPLVPWLRQALIPQLRELSVPIAALQKLIPEHFTDCRPQPRRICSVTPYKILVVSDKQNSKKIPNKQNKKWWFGKALGICP